MNQVDQHIGVGYDNAYWFWGAHPLLPEKANLGTLVIIEPQG